MVISFKKFYFMLIVLSMTMGLFAADNDNPDVRWEVNPGVFDEEESSFKKYFYQVTDQDYSENEFVIKENNSKVTKLTSYNYYSLNPMTGEMLSKKVVDIKEGDEAFKVVEYSDFYLKVYGSKKIEVYNLDDSVRFTIDAGNKTIWDYKYIEESNSILVDFWIFTTSCNYESYDLETGDIKYNIEYNIKYSMGAGVTYQLLNRQTPRYIKDNVLCIYNKAKDIWLFDVNTGKEIGKLEDVIKSSKYDSVQYSENSLLFIYPSLELAEVVDFDIPKVIKSVSLINKSVFGSKLDYMVNDNLLFVLLDHNNSRKKSIGCVDIDSQKILWEMPVKTAYSPKITYLNSNENKFYTFDDNNVYKFDKKTGKVIWKSQLKINRKQAIQNIAVNEEYNRIDFYVGTNKPRESYDSIAYYGFGAISIDDGSLIYNLETDSLVSRKYRYNEDLTIYANETEIYVVNNENGNVSYKVDLSNELKRDNIIDFLYYQKEDSMVLLCEKNIHIFDIDSRKIKRSLSLSHKDKLFGELISEFEIIGDYLFYTQIKPLIRSPYGSAPGNCYKYMFDLKKMNIDWKLLIGINTFDKNGTLNYYKKYGTEPYYDIQTGIFFSRYENFEKNLLVIIGSDGFLLNAYRGYKLFKDDRIPTSEEINNSIAVARYKK